MKSTFKVLFYLKRNKETKSGEVMIMARITIDGNMCQFSTKQKINPKNWSVKLGKATGRTAEMVEINNLLDEIKASLYKVYHEMMRVDNYVTAEKIKNKFLGKNEDCATLIEMFNKHNEDVKALVGISKSQATYQKYEVTKRHLSEFLQYKYKLKDIAVREITPMFITDFEVYLMTACKCSTNTTAKFMQFFKRIIIIARDNGYMKSDPFSNYKIRIKQVDRGYLTEAEIAIISQKEFVSERLEQVRDVFIFSCFTGLSYIDVKNLTKEHLRTSFDGKLWIMTKRQKTDTSVNAQQRAVAIHHLDTPWRPSDLAQRDGRAIRKGNEIAKLYANNKVDVVIYAVEKSLDSYKFNLLHNKQLFISQLKSGAMGARTIDEGTVDEKSGMNFSEYMAILSGNTDLLDKAKIEKKITSLESERKAFNKNKNTSVWKLQENSRTFDRNNEIISRMTSDWTAFNERVQMDKDGNKLNPIKLDGVTSSDVKDIGARLKDIDEKARTEGGYKKIGKLYGFELLVKTEASMKDGFDFKQNRFFVGGEYKYSYNNGNMATDPKLASLNFLNALERIPKYIEQYQTANVKLEQDIPVLQQVVDSTWKKEDELKELKSELATLERKIQLSLKPMEQNEQGQNADGEKVDNNGQAHQIDSSVTSHSVTSNPNQTDGLSNDGRESYQQVAAHSAMNAKTSVKEQVDRPRMRM